jgi:hypothetical protein
MLTISSKKGMTLVELLIAMGLLMLVFGGIFTAFQVTLKIVGSSKAHAGALSLANERMEYIRSLPYDDVGTVSGIPNGDIPQNATTSLNGIDYAERILIEYVDAPEDGTDVSDDNGIVADYKRVKVEYSWTVQGESKVISLISNIVPPGIETTAGGGTLRVNVFDAETQPLSGASVRLYNNTGTSTIDVTRLTNAQGIALFSGAPALANYQITVTDTGYSTDQTYSATTSNPNPTTQHVAVLEAQVSTMNFQIDELSQLTVYTKDTPASGEHDDSFDDASEIATSSDTQVIGGALTLADTAGVYVLSGTALSSTIAPTPLESWDTLFLESVLPASTSVRVQLYEVTGTSTYTILPDSALPGNSVGFTSGTISLSGINTATYDSLALLATLTSSSSATTSALRSWRLTYTEEQSPIPGVSFTMTGAKTIGTYADSSPVYKYQDSHTTNGSGSVTLSNLEWDLYDIVLSGGSYDIAEACEDVPYSLAPGVTEDLILTLESNAAYSQRVVVSDVDGNPLPGALVRIRKGGLDEEKETSACGQVFFNSGLSAAADYRIDVSKTGYVTQTADPYEINGDEVLVVTLLSS